MFEAILKYLKPEKPTVSGQTIDGGTSPNESVKRKAWAVILADGRVGYIDHYKVNGLFGVRPVRFDNGMHYPSTSEHWTPEQRASIPEELALKITEIRGAQPDEIPPTWRGA